MFSGLTVETCLIRIRSARLPILTDWPTGCLTDWLADNSDRMEITSLFCLRGLHQNLRLANQRKVDGGNDGVYQASITRELLNRCDERDPRFTWWGIHWRHWYSFQPFGYFETSSSPHPPRIMLEKHRYLCCLRCHDRMKKIRKCQNGVEFSHHRKDEAK